MNTPKPAAMMDDALFRVERKIARRADELSRLLGYDPGHALDHWRQAEREVWVDAESFEVRGLESEQAAS
ncbi:MAG TPA: DUF2934 domain-containing protein [Opitutaceae bacterium]|nr:DUF2934 domain-containing protein [Opitutaceae bacterium]